VPLDTRLAAKRQKQDQLRVPVRGRRGKMCKQPAWTATLPTIPAARMQRTENLYVRKKCNQAWHSLRRLVDFGHSYGRNQTQEKAGSTYISTGGPGDDGFSPTQPKSCGLANTHGCVP